MQKFCHAKKCQKNVMTIVKIMLVNGATSATPERSFLMTRKMKTWLRSTMLQRRSNALGILNSNKSLVDKLPPVKFVSDLVDSRPSRGNDFGFFTEEDLKK